LRRLKLKADFGGESADLVIVQAGRETQSLVPAEGPDVSFLPTDIARVAAIDLQLFFHIRSKSGDIGEK
jgi:hypothetical protein